MSLLNIVLDRERALIGTDTLAGSLDGNIMGEYSKCLVFPHLGALACRGNAFFFQFIVTAVALSFARSVEELFPKMPGMLNQCFGDLVAAMPQLGVQDDPTLYDPQTFALVGWSLNKRRMMGRIYEQTSREQGFVENEINPGVMAPGDKSLEALCWELGAYKTPEAMEKLAHAQVKFTKEAGGAHLPVGGRLMLTELSRDSISVTHGCYLTPMVLGAENAQAEAASMITGYGRRVPA